MSVAVPGSLAVPVSLAVSVSAAGPPPQAMNHANRSALALERPVFIARHSTTGEMLAGYFARARVPIRMGRRVIEMMGTALSENAQ